MDCGHDEGFYQRFHDISTECAAERQHFMHVWLMKYTISLEGAGKRAKGQAWSERYLAERASPGRERNGLPGIISADSLADDVGADVEPEDGNLLTFLIQQLGVAGTQSPESGDWTDVVAAGIEEARVARERRAEERRIQEEEWEAYKASPEYLQLIKDQTEYFGASEQEEREFMASSRLRLLESLPGATPENLTQEILEYLVYITDTDEEELDAWQRKTWEQPGGYRPLPTADDSASVVQKSGARPKDSIPESWLPYVNEGETRETIERNAAAAGFYWELDYLEWRSEASS